MERHFQTILVSLITGGIIFVCAFTLNTNASMKVMAIQIEQLVSNIKDLREMLNGERSSNTSRLDSLERDKNNNALRIMQLDRDLSSLGSRVLVIENAKSKK